MALGIASRTLRTLEDSGDRGWKVKVVLASNIWTMYDYVLGLWTNIWKMVVFHDLVYGILNGIYPLVMTFKLHN